MTKMFVSILIPSYNRPGTLLRLLNSIDVVRPDIEIVICEDNSPLRTEIRNVVNSFTQAHPEITLLYIENESNLGYDKNLRQLINNAEGEYVVFMGDDDMFIPKALDKYIGFLIQHRHCGYILRSYRNIYKDGSIQYFRYFDGNREFEAGLDSYINLFDKSVFISGFCVKRDYTKPFLTSNLDGSLLFQLYLLGEICLRYPSAYCEIPLTQAVEGDTVPMFGSSESEKGLYTPGTITVENSVNFLKKYFEVIEYIDHQNNLNSLPVIRKNMSKYSYPTISIQWSKGRKEYKRYVRELRRIGLDNSFYFEIYNAGLLLLGKKHCDKIIRFIKNVLGRRPRL